MSTENLRTGHVRPTEVREPRDSRDPRSRLVREKYFSLRPRPLERWLWGQGIPAAAERVFWLHWQEGMKRGDWCSEIPIRRVAAECQLDVSTVTRAYQWLAKQGCLRRTDPGRDAANPFQQATAITEVRVPRELLVEFDRHPSRAPRVPANPATDSAPRHPEPAAAPPTTPRSEPTAAPATAATTATSTIAPASPSAPNPFPGLSGRERLRALAQLTAPMSPAERRQYDEAFRTHGTHILFDADSRLTPPQRARVLEVLAALAAQPRRMPAAEPAPAPTPAAAGPRRLSDFELARLRRDLQSATSATHVPELLRQVAWSVEEGALRRFSVPHAIHIAMKKIREGAWTRPNRMPPNWARGFGAPARPETCRTA